MLQLCALMSHYPIIHLKSGKEKSLQRSHPWVFSGALHEDFKQFPEGSVVRVLDNKNNYLATGYIQYGSIAVRVLSFIDEVIDADFWIKTFQNSFNLRESIGLIESKTTNCFRLIHGEGDGIPGLIVDFYNGVAVIQCHTSGIYYQLDLIQNAIQTVLGSRVDAIFNKSKETLHGAIPDIENSCLWGSADSRIVLENNIKFKVDWTTGQKTGFFLDQRDNRTLLGSYSKNKKVLNTFAYTGGFSVYALMNGASHVDSVDVSKTAIDLLKQNMDLNAPEATNHQAEAKDTFVFFKEHEDLYDILVLDPPAFAKNIGARHNALMGYKRLNMEGIKKVKKGGLLFTFSCSQVVDSLQFNQIIMSAAIESKRKVKVIHRLTQPADHPVNVFHPEGEYLKGLVLYID